MYEKSGVYKKSGQKLRQALNSDRVKGRNTGGGIGFGPKTTGKVFGPSYGAGMGSIASGNLARLGPKQKVAPTKRGMK